MAENRYRFEPATIWDTDFLFQVYASTREEEMAKTGWDDVSIDQFLHLQYKLQNTQYHHKFPKASYNIVALGNERVGRLYVDRSKNEIRIIDISLLTEFRRKGLGTRIMNDLIAEAEAAGLPLRLSCERTNPARHLYERLGFTITGEAGIYLAMERPAPGLFNKKKRKEKKKR